MRLRTGLVLMAIALSFVLGRVALAEESGEKTSTLDLGEIVITPTKTEKAVRDLSLSVGVVTREQIAASTANSATEILNILPGVFVHKTGDFGRADVVIRGHGSRGRRVMVLVDGKPEKMGLFGCTITHALPLDNIERIEVVRGSSSVLYGSDALGGVINIITKEPQEKSEGDLTLAYGSFDTQLYRLRQGGKLGDFNYYFTFDKRDSRGHRPNSDYNHNNFNLRLGQDLIEDLKLTFSTRYFDGFKREPEPSTSGTWNDYERGAYDLTFEGSFFDMQQMLKLYRNFGHHRFSDGWESKDYTLGAMFHLNLKPLEGNDLLVGAEFREQGGKVISGGISGKYDKDEFALFFHDEHKLFDERLILNGGLRYNDDNRAGSIVCPAAGLVWHIFDTTSFRTSVNKGFRAPQLNELKFFGSSNPDLKPERSWNYEWGLNQKLSDNLNLDFVYFILQADEFIAVRSGKFQNIDEVDFRGIETALEYLPSENLSLRLSFTHQDSEEYTQGRPENELDLLFLYKMDKFTFSATGQYVDNYFAADNEQEAIPNFFLVNTKLLYNISSALEAYLEINNLFNVEHKLYVDLAGSAAGVYTQPGRTFSLGLTYKW